MKTNIKQLIDTIGIFGVVVSLGFVGVQLMLDRKVALGAAYQNRADSRKDDLRSRFESDDYVADLKRQIERGIYPAWWNEGVASMHAKESIPIEELIRRAFQQQIDLTQLDNLVYQHELGLIDDSSLDTVLKQWQRGSLSRGDPLLDGVLGMDTARKETYSALEPMKSSAD